MSSPTPHILCVQFILTDCATHPFLAQTFPSALACSIRRQFVCINLGLQVRFDSLSVTGLIELHSCLPTLCLLWWRGHFCTRHRRSHLAETGQTGQSLIRGGLNGLIQHCNSHMTVAAHANWIRGHDNSFEKDECWGKMLLTSKVARLQADFSSFNLVSFLRAALLASQGVEPVEPNRAFVEEMKAAAGARRLTSYAHASDSHMIHWAPHRLLEVYVANPVMMEIDFLRRHWSYLQPIDM